MKADNDKLTISVDKKIKDRFKELCEKEGLKIGKQIELFMSNELKKRDSESEKKEDESEENSEY